MKKDCLFCKIKKNWIFENENFYAIFDVHPVSPGHSLIIPKKHIISLLDLNQEQWASLKPAISKTIEVIENTNFQKLYRKMIIEKPTKKSPPFCEKMLLHMGIKKKPKGYNIGNNEGSTAGRTIHHLHIQIIPRYEGDIKDPTGGIRTIIPGLGNYKK
jgi:diadenosine tetraphosphate (Ap4A) HIT family hydrolase